MKVRLVVAPALVEDKNKVLILVHLTENKEQMAVALALPEEFDEELFMSRARNAFATLRNGLAEKK